MMNKTNDLKGKACSFTIMLAAALLAPAVRAQVTLQDANSSAYVNVNSSAGMSQWLVDGVNNLNQQWFWYRVGSGGQAPINNISSANYYQSAANTLDSTYANGSYSVEINYTLTGGGAGSGSADIGEGITIRNLTGSTLDFHFYQYSNFRLYGYHTPSDSVVMNNSQAYQYNNLANIAEGIIAPPANEFEAGLTTDANSTLYKLGNVNNLVLDSSKDSAGPGDATWAYEWDLSIAGNSSVDITKDKLINLAITPEPPSFMVVALGFMVLLVCRAVPYWNKKHSH